MIDKIIKRDGRIVPFKREKITLAILQAAISVGGRDRATAEKVTDDVIAMLESLESKQSYPNVEEVQDLVEKCLIERGHAKTAKAYIIYRYEHALKRLGKQSLTYSSDNIPYQKLWLALSWGVDHNCISLDQIATIIKKDRYRDLIEASEDFYQNEVDDAVRLIMERIDNIKIIIIAGPSSSGKTTTTIKIRDILKDKGYKLVTLNVDNYYFDLKDQPKDPYGDYDYETPQAIDLNLINRHLKDLIEGKTVPVPFYNFKTGNREGISQELALGNREILLIDSLHGLYDEMTSGVPDTVKFKLYIETLSQIKDRKNIYVRWADVRMLRRMVRDMQFRNYSPKQTVAHWHYVRRSELRYIVSRLQKAHFVVNSFLAYELPIMKHRLGHLFSKFIEEFKKEPEREDALSRVQRVSEMFSEIPAWEDESVIPPRSVLREFIGGSEYTY
ncbi:MAG: response regulator SirA [Spirochaetota bacterium]|nr:MAG: response regulator SirA [Spirochaetota bacterium]